MLVLARQQEETVIIGDDIQVKVVSIRGGKVKLGFSAPRHLSVHRHEVYHRAQQQKRNSLDAEEVRPSRNGRPSQTGPSS